ncbi:hypothetical protein ABFS83_09G042300 [Erythranthe nasuta]
MYRLDISFRMQEEEKEREVENLEKEVANLKVQIEAKDSAYKQALIKIDHHQQTANELSILLTNSELQKDLYINQSQEADLRINELESSLERTSHQLSESEKAREKLSYVTSFLESTLFQLQSLEIESLVMREKQMDYVSAKEAELELAAEALLDANETIRDLENKFTEKSTYIDSLKEEVKQANDLRIFHEKVASDAISELNRLKDEAELHEKKNSDQSAYIGLLETELRQLRTALVDAKDETKKNENDAQIEIALLKSEIHKGRSKTAAAEAAEARAQGEKSTLYNALQQMGLEAEETKKENRMLKEALMQENNEVKTEEEERDENGGELENTKKELENAISRIGEMRARAEQAISRAEAAEKAKAAMDEKMKRRKEHKERRKAALVALREESFSRDFGNSTEINEYDDAASAKNYQPLGKGFFSSSLDSGPDSGEMTCNTGRGSRRESSDDQMRKPWPPRLSPFRVFPYPQVMYLGPVLPWARPTSF